MPEECNGFQVMVMAYQTDIKMSLGSHLGELRVRLLRALAGFIVAFFVSMGFGKWFVRVLLSPYQMAMDSLDISVRLQAIQPAEPFLVYLKACLVLALLLSSPWLFYQLWAFIAAGLYSHERTVVYRITFISTGLFVIGVVFFLLGIAPWVFRFFIRFDLGLDFLTYQPGLGRTMDFILGLSIVFGLAFQTPIWVVFAQRWGLVSLHSLQQARKYVFLGAFILGAMATPPDVISQIALAIPLYVLYEAGLAVIRLKDKKPPSTD